MFERIGHLGDRLLGVVVPQVRAAAASKVCNRQWSGPACRCCYWVSGSYTSPVRCGAYDYRTCSGC